MNKILILIGVWGIFWLSALAQERTDINTERPNVVLIVSHGHGSADLGCYGNTYIKTPNLDKLAAEGIRFTNSYTTVASGSASQSVILTGLYSHATGQYGQSNGQNHFSVFPEIISLPAYLKKAGYRTALNGALPLELNRVFTFDTILATDVYAYNTYEMAERCKSFISDIHKKPFFLYFCPANPYRSNSSSEEGNSLVNTFGNQSRGNETTLPTYYKPGQIEVPAYLPDFPECRKELAQYAQAVSRMDAGLGRLFELLKKEGIWDQTLIIYITDSGVAFPGAQETIYEPGIKLPCIVKLPFNKALTNTCDAMISWVDLTPTILDVCNALPAEYRFHGLSFKEAMLQEHPTGWDEIHATHTFHDITMYYPMRMVMNRRYKLIWNIAWQLPFPISNDLVYSATWQTNLQAGSELFGKRSMKNLLHRSEFELYDLINDPNELKNLAYDPDFVEIIRDLKSRLKGFQAKTNDPWITQWNE